MVSKVEAERKKRIKKTARITFWFVVIGLLSGTTGWYYWQMKQELMTKSAQIRQLELEIEQEKNESSVRADSFMFELIMEPFGWTIRDELLSDNLEKVHQYLTQYVKHPSIELLAVIDDEGTILSSTDKKIEKRKFDDVFPKYTLHETKLVINKSVGQIHVSQPLMGFDTPLGSIYMIFNPSNANQ
ncbi:MAG: hypothetical protein HKN87_12195 [Saprospiraceae bacterium]|nr:hypothetical protein [Saprospiraceae bacterium]